MPHGPAGTDKAAAEQNLLDEAMVCFPSLLDPGWIWLMDRNYHGAPRIARMIACTHVLIRLKSDILLKRTSPILPDGSYRAELSGDGVTDDGPGHRVLRRCGGPGGAGDVLPDHRPDGLGGHPAAELAALYAWRWDGSETALREAKASLHGAGRYRADAPLRVPGPGGAGTRRLGRRHRDGPRRRPRRRARRRAPRQGRRAGLAVRPRDLSFARAVRSVLSAIRLGHACYRAVTSEIAEYRNVAHRTRHRAWKSKSPSSFAHAGPADAVTRIAPAVITMANTPA